ncbi:catenin alpha-2-like protein [Labeo rohita]|uniref:Catenin alpha-2-like protein n=1 Tax=Labeo rohita TaxID=84645 RepID=A0A498NPC9_LABRO|nr:catenin alpha-2-like protein [Labeo rohita]
MMMDRYGIVYFLAIAGVCVGVLLVVAGVTDGIVYFLAIAGVCVGVLLVVAGVTGRTYRATGQADTALHAMATLQVYQAKVLKHLHERGPDQGAMEELRAAFALWATKVTARSLGQLEMPTRSQVSCDLVLMVELGEVKEESKQDRYPILRDMVILGVKKKHNQQGIIIYKAPPTPANTLATDNRPGTSLFLVTVVTLVVLYLPYVLVHCVLILHFRISLSCYFFKHSPGGALYVFNWGWGCRTKFGDT